MNGPIRYEESWRVSSAACDPQGWLRPGALAGALQEVAWRHAEQLGFGYTALAQRNEVWLLARLSLHMERIPRWGDLLRLTTWPSGRDRLFAYRDTRIAPESPDDPPIGSAATNWIMIDREARHPLDPRPRLPEPQGGFPPPDHVRRAEKLAPPTDPLDRESRAVRFTDLDVNGHMNNARYIEWFWDHYTDRPDTSPAWTACHINFLAEARLGDLLTLHTEQTGSHPVLTRAQWTLPDGRPAVRICLEAPQRA